MTCTSTTKRNLFGALFLSLGFVIIIPHHAFAQLEVPVNDGDTANAVDEVGSSIEDFHSDFQTYAQQYRRYTLDDEQNSLRALISLNPDSSLVSNLYLPGKTSYAIGRRSESFIDPDNKDKTQNADCETDTIANGDIAHAAEGGAWESLEKHGYINKSQTDYSMTKVNDSTSLSCLLQEMVEQNKLSLNLQIHNLLRSYLADAQAAALAQRAAGMLAKANKEAIDNANTNTTYDIDGNPVMVTTNSAFSEDDAPDIEAREQTLQNFILGSGGATSSFQISDVQKFAVARKLLEDAHYATLKPVDQMAIATRNTLTQAAPGETPDLDNEADLPKFFATGESNTGLLETWQDLLDNEQDTPEGLVDMMSGMQYMQFAMLAQKNQEARLSGGGSVGIRRCPDDNPDCTDPDDKITATPGTYVVAAGTNGLLSQDNKTQSVKTASDLAGANTDIVSSPSNQALTTGVSGMNSDAFVPTQPTDKYIGDFMSAIQDGYFDLQSGTTDWATGAMLTIYDAVMQDKQAFEDQNTLDETDNSGDAASSTRP